MDVIELAAVKYAEEDPYNRYEKCFIEGAKWQQERSYSEEELREAIHESRMQNDKPEDYVFEQFKKK